MEAPVYSESEEESDESLGIMPEDIEDEVDINIHFHCEHCIKLSKCVERPKPGWSCDIIECIHGCGLRFHACKLEEHEILCSHIKVPCLNVEFGCPHSMQRYCIFAHLPICPASIVVCNAEWNRWAVGARERERISPAGGVCSLFEANDLDVAFAISDQKLVNEMHSYPKYLRKLLCNGITKRFPSLPLTVRGSYLEEHVPKHIKERGRSNSTTDDDEEGLTPDISIEHLEGQKKWNDISAQCCSHGILKDICQFCKNDPDEPDFKYGDVWREKVDQNHPGIMLWKKEHRIEKIRKRGPLGFYSYKRFDESDEEDLDNNDKIEEEERPSCRKFRFPTPPPAPLTPKGLILEIGIKHYSHHQVKPKSMFTFQCMQELRRDEFSSHYKNVHSEIQEGLDGWLGQRCPLHIVGCPFSVRRLCPGKEDTNVIFCHQLGAFGIKPCDELSEQRSHLRSSSIEKSVFALSQLKLKNNGMNPILEHPLIEEEKQFLASSGHITYLPFEILQRIARHLDGFSLNNLSLTSHLMRDVCYSLLDEKGLILQEWIRTFEDGKIRWKNGNNRWFFSKSFDHVSQWSIQNEGNITNHLLKCPFNDRKVNDKKFCYLPKIGEEIKRQFNNMQKT